MAATSTVVVRGVVPVAELATLRTELFRSLAT